MHMIYTIYARLVHYIRLCMMHIFIYVYIYIMHNMHTCILIKNIYMKLHIHDIHVPSVHMTLWFYDCVNLLCVCCDDTLFLLPVVSLSFSFVLLFWFYIFIRFSCDHYLFFMFFIHIIIIIC